MLGPDGRLSYLFGFIGALAVSETDTDKFFPKTLTLEETSQAITTFYTDAVNLPITAADAVRIVAAKSNGGSPDAVVAEARLFVKFCADQAQGQERKN